MWKELKSDNVTSSFKQQQSSCIWRYLNIIQNSGPRNTWLGKIPHLRHSYIKSFITMVILTHGLKDCYEAKPVVLLGGSVDRLDSLSPSYGPWKPFFIILSSHLVNPTIHRLASSKQQAQNPINLSWKPIYIYISLHHPSGVIEQNIHNGKDALRNTAAVASKGDFAKRLFVRWQWCLHPSKTNCWGFFVSSNEIGMF